MTKRESECEKALLSIQQASERLYLSASTVRGLIESGRLRAVDFATKGNSRIYRIKPEWIDDLIEQSKIQPVTARVKQSQNLRPSKYATIRRHA